MAGSLMLEKEDLDQRLQILCAFEADDSSLLRRVGRWEGGEPCCWVRDFRSAALHHGSILCDPVLGKQLAYHLRLAISGSFAHYDE